MTKVENFEIINTEKFWRYYVYKQIIELPPPRKLGLEKGFTLAETLITLGIIGVVASLTLPTLIQNHRDRVIVTQVNKAYNLFSNAFEMAQAKYGPAEMWTVPDDTQSANDLWYERIAENLKIVEDCGNSGAFWICKKPNSKIYPYKGLYQTGDQYSSITGTSNHSGILNNGMMFSIDQFMTSGEKWWGRYGYIVVDINGTKGPHQIGKDIFRFEIADKTSNWGKFVSPVLYPEGSGTARFGNPESCLENTYSGYTCTSWIILYNNTDYLHCREKMLKDGTHSCNE